MCRRWITSFEKWCLKLRQHDNIPCELKFNINLCNTNTSMDGISFQRGDDYQTHNIWLKFEYLIIDTNNLLLLYQCSIWIQQLQTTKIIHKRWFDANWNP